VGVGIAGVGYSGRLAFWSDDRRDCTDPGATDWPGNTVEVPYVV
jgi:hypothetical protein